MMKTPPLAQIGPAFIAAVCALPTGAVEMDDLLAPFIEAEAELRKIFVQEPLNDILTDPHLGLLDFFSSPEQLRKTRSRDSGLFSTISDEEFFDQYPTSPQHPDFQTLIAKHVLCLPPSVRRQTGAPSSVNSLVEFRERWDIFTQGILKNLKWNNVLVAGGAVQACLQPIPLDGLSELYHDSTVYQKSDIDLFLWGLNENEAKEKITQIYWDLKSSTSCDMVCIRKRHVISIHAAFPLRTIQIVLRLYRSPAEILAGFDIDCACSAYDGDKVLMNPRAAVSMMTQCNTIDLTRLSPVYEMRHAKYADRGFEVFVPILDRSKVNPKIYNDVPNLELHGLARLLTLEALRISTRQRGQSTPAMAERNPEDDGKMDLLTVDEDTYDPTLLAIPYGPGWNAHRVKQYCLGLEKKLNAYGLVREMPGIQLPGIQPNRIRETNTSGDEKPQLHWHPLLCSDTIEGCLGEVCNAECPQQHRNWYAKEKFLIPGPFQFITFDSEQQFSGNAMPLAKNEWNDEI